LIESVGPKQALNQLAKDARDLLALIKDELDEDSRAALRTAANLIDAMSLPEAGAVKGEAAPTRSLSLPFGFAAK